jgi:hypothetical protein
MDRLFSIKFSAKPIVVHARDEKQALELAFEYLRQRESNRITIEPTETVCESKTGS